MKLFKGHAVLPRVGHERTHVVRSCVVIADTWQQARARIWDAVPCVEFVTVPVEVADVLMTDVALLGEREFEDLRSGCAWNENRGGKVQASQGHVGRLDDINRSEKSP